MYVEDVHHVWRECFRVLRTGGVILAGLDTAVAYLFNEEDPLRVVNKLPFNPLKNTEHAKLAEKDGCYQFSHSLEEQLGGQLRAGLVLTDLFEDFGNEGGIDEFYPCYVATRAVKAILDP